jgi:hypothetical protein
METLRIATHSLAGWSTYGEEIGFVPDPMILRTGEVFLNGASGTHALERRDFDVWDALQQNIGGLLDFFDMVVTREVIPLINYGDTFDRMKIMAPLDRLLPDRIRPVEIDYSVYNAIKKGALLKLAEVDLPGLARFGDIALELRAFRYEWEPALSVPDSEPAVDAAREKFAAVDEATRRGAQFLLGGFIFSGFAQASQSTHYIQPKRARFFLGLTAASDRAGAFSFRDEDAIFAAAAARLRDTRAEMQNADPVPPVLPYLLAQGEPTNVRELLDRAIAFRDSVEGKRFRRVVADIRADGVKGRRAEDAVRREREQAIAFLAPHSKLDAKRSRSLEVKLSAETVGVPFVKAGAETSVKLGIPTWLRLWWNDEVPFGGMRKTLRRMWMAVESYQDLAGKLQRVWVKS